MSLDFDVESGGAPYVLECRGIGQVSIPAYLRKPREAAPKLLKRSKETVGCTDVLVREA